MPEIRSSDAEIVVVADADVWTDGLSAAVTAVKDGAPWAMPHTEVHRLSKDGRGLAQEPYRGALGGGIVVAPRQTLLDIPLDPRFVGWGQEDHSWGLALTTLAGIPWRGEATLTHFWHPPQERITRKYGSVESKALYLRYVTAARTDPRAMRDLIEEIREPQHPDQPPLHDHPANCVV